MKETLLPLVSSAAHIDYLRLVQDGKSKRVPVGAVMDAAREAALDTEAFVTAIAAGITGTYGTYALAHEDIASIAVGAHIIILVDETHDDRRTVYRRDVGGLTYLATAADDRQRSNHSGTQAIATVTGLDDALSGKVPGLWCVRTLRELAEPSIAGVVNLRGYHDVPAIFAKVLGGGEFILDPDDTTSPDDGGWCIVDAIGRRWKRPKQSGFTAADWGAVGDGVAKPLSTWFDTIEDAQVHYPAATALANNLAYHPLADYFDTLEAAQAVYPFATHLFHEIDYCALQAMLNHGVRVTSGVILPVKASAPAAIYAVSDTLLLPPGTSFIGDGRSMTTAKRCTLLLQTSTCGDVIRFVPHIDTSNGQKWWFGYLGHFVIRGSLLAQPGHGIHWVDAGGAIVRTQDSTTIDHVTVRGMNGHGMYSPGGGTPCLIISYEGIFNQGYGLLWKNRAESIHMVDPSFDGNTLGGLCFEDSPANSVVVIDNLKAEERINLTWGGEAQPSALEIKNNGDGACFVVNGLSVISSVPDLVANPAGTIAKKPTATIVHSGGYPPNLSARAVQTRVRVTDTGADPTHFSSTLSIAIPRAISHFNIGNKNRVERSTNNGVYWSFGLTDAPHFPGVFGPGLEIAGDSPGLQLWETDGPSAANGWLTWAGSGILNHRVVDNSGATTTHHRTSLNVAGKPYHELGRLVVNLGATLAAGDFALTGWGNAATLTINNASKDGRFDITVTSGGTGQAANPSVALTYKDGAFASPPMPLVNGWNDTDLVGLSLKSVASTTGLTIQLLDGATPVAGKAYRIQGHIL